MNFLYNKYSEFRSGWKIFLAAMLSIAVGIAIITLVEIVFIGYLYISGDVIIGDQIDTIVKALDSYPIYSTLISISGNVAVIIAVAIMWKINEKSGVSSFGLINIKKGYKDLIIGLAIGAIGITIVAMILLVSGDVKLVNEITSPNFSISIISGMVLFISVGVAEEVFTRGYCMSVLKQTRNKWIVLFIPAILFSAIHLTNKGISILALINIFLAGVVFAYMFMKSKKIWMPIGFHITWNFFQGYIWGFNVSGVKVDGLYKTDIVSNTMINGGSFGPEGGLAVTVILLLTIGIVRLYYKNTKIDEFMSSEVE